MPKIDSKIIGKGLFLRGSIKFLELGINIHKNKVRNCNIEKAIGYKEINNYLEGKVSLEEATNLVLSKTKKFAKRQYTWFENRYEENLKVRSNVNPSLVVESFIKII